MDGPEPKCNPSSLYSIRILRTLRTLLLEPDLFEPAAAVSHPPGNVDDRNGGSDGPPDWQYDIGQDSEDGERGPEDLALHTINCKSFRRRPSRSA